MTRLTLDDPVDFTIPQGLVFSLDLEPFEDNANTVRSDIEAYEVVIQGRRHAGHPYVLFEYSTTNGKLVKKVAANDPPGMLVTMDLDAVDTAAVESGGIYELYKYLAGQPDERVPLHSGRFGVDKAVARRPL